MTLEDLKNQGEQIIEEISSSQSVIKGLKNAFTQIEGITTREKLYSFGLYTSGDYTYLAITSNTLEGLNISAAEYRSESNYSQLDIGELEIMLKWSPPDWNYHCTLEPIEFDFVDKKLQDLLGVGDEIMALNLDIDQRLNGIEESIFKPLEKLFTHSLLQLKNELGSQADGIIFGIWKGDQSEEERQEFIKSLNSENLFNTYCAESKRGYKIG